jgi:hypothetical protein
MKESEGRDWLGCVDDEGEGFGWMRYWLGMSRVCRIDQRVNHLVPYITFPCVPTREKEAAIYLVAKLPHFPRSTIRLHAKVGSRSRKLQFTWLPPRTFILVLSADASSATLFQIDFTVFTLSTGPSYHL